MREGWTIRTIGEVALHLCDGSHNPPVGIDFSKYPMLSSKNIFFDSYDYSEPRYLTKEQFDIENKRTNVSDGDILLTIVGTIGRVCCIKEPFQPFTLQRSVAVIKPNKNIIISRYLMYCLCGLNAYFNKEAKGVAQKGIYLKQLSKISIPVPPLQEQERIVAELDLLTEIIDKQKQQLKELDTLAQSIFYDMFGSPDANEKEWIMKSLAEIGTIVSGSTPSTSDESNWDGDVNWVTPAELGVQLFYGETRRKITSKAAKSLTIMPIGTLLMSSRAPIGKLAITSVPMCCNQGFKNIVCGNNVNNIYLYYCLMLNINSIKAMGRGATFKEVSKQAVSSFEIMLPPMNLQELFAQKILSIESQKKSINRSIAESQKLFDYTMDKYFG